MMNKEMKQKLNQMQHTQRTMHMIFVYQNNKIDRKITI